MAVQVFTPYQGRIIGLFASVGDDVKKGQTLFTIDSPDLLQAESTLIAAAGVLRIDHAQPRASPRALQDAGDIAARSRPGGLRPADRRRQSAGGARRRAPVRQDRRRHRPDHRRAQGRSDAGRAEPDHRSRHGAQCGAGPVRAAGQCRRRRSLVADTDTMWMLANVAGSGQPGVPGRAGGASHACTHFPAVCSTARSPRSARASMPNTRRVLVRSEIKDPQHELRSGMFANFVIRVGPPDALAGDSARRRRARGRRHHDRLGHRRSPPLHQADGQDRHSSTTATGRFSKACNSANWSRPRARCS